MYDGKTSLRLVGVRLSDLINGNAQIGLFTASEERYNLYQAMDKIRDRFGEKAMKLASTIGLPL